MPLFHLWRFIDASVHCQISNSRSESFLHPSYIASQAVAKLEGSVCIRSSCRVVHESITDSQDDGLQVPLSRAPILDFGTGLGGFGSFKTPRFLTSRRVQCASVDSCLARRVGLGGFGLGLHRAGFCSRSPPPHPRDRTVFGISSDIRLCPRPGSRVSTASPSVSSCPSRARPLVHSRSAGASASQRQV